MNKISATKQIILGPADKPLMVLERYPLEFDSTYIHNAYFELSEKGKQNETGAWGYFPEMPENTNTQYPHCYLLGKIIDEHIFSNMLSKDERKQELAFIKMSEGSLAGSYGGLHFDVTSGVGIYQANEENARKDILRCIINLHQTPRVLKYVEVPKGKLKELGVNIDERKYRPINLPKNVDVQTIEIPEVSGDQIWLIKFWSNIVPHVGETDERGHFVAGFGQYLDRDAEQ